ncbi:hypothetical protein, partial [Laspinema olomoucense]
VFPSVVGVAEGDEVGFGDFGGSVGVESVFPSVVGVAEGDEVGFGDFGGSVGVVFSVVGLERIGVPGEVEVASPDPSLVGASVGFKAGLGEKSGTANPPQAVELPKKEVEFPWGEVVGLLD